jgi:hypothetical protein
MKWPDFIFSTSSSVCLVSQGNVEILFQDLRSSYGISWSDTHLYVGSLIGVEKFGEDLKKEKEVKSASSESLHQILFVNNKLHVALPKEQEIQIFDEDLERIKTHKIKNDPLKKDTGKPSQLNYNSHINSIFYKDKFFYVCHHNRGDPSFVSIHHDNDFFEITGRIENFGSQNHNVYVEKNILYTLSSKNAQLIKFNINKQSMSGLEIAKKGERFLRGFARTKDCFIVGSAPDVMRVDRDKFSSKILMLDNNLELVDEMDVGNYGGQIREIRVLDGDLAHNGILCPVKQ